MAAETPVWCVRQSHRLLPGSLASHEELLELGRGVADGGGGVFELASSWNLYDDAKHEWRWLSEMASIDGLRITTGGGNGMTPETAWSHRDMLRMLDKVTAEGGDMWITPMMRLGTLFMGIHSEALNPLRVRPLSIQESRAGVSSITH